MLFEPRSASAAEIHGRRPNARPHRRVLRVPECREGWLPTSRVIRVGECLEQALRTHFGVKNWRRKRCAHLPEGQLAGESLATLFRREKWTAQALRSVSRAKDWLRKRCAPLSVRRMAGSSAAPPFRHRKWAAQALRRLSHREDGRRNRYVPLPARDFADARAACGLPQRMWVANALRPVFRTRYGRRVPSWPLGLTLTSEAPVAESHFSTAWRRLTETRSASGREAPPSRLRFGFCCGAVKLRSFQPGTVWRTFHIGRGLKSLPSPQVVVGDSPRLNRAGRMVDLYLSENAS